VGVKTFKNVKYNLIKNNFVCNKCYGCLLKKNKKSYRKMEVKFIVGKNKFHSKRIIVEISL